MATNRFNIVQPDKNNRFNIASPATVKASGSATVKPYGGWDDFQKDVVQKSFKDAGNLAKSIFIEAPARFGVALNQDLFHNGETYTPSTPADKFLLGNEPVKPYMEQQNEAEQALKSAGLGKTSMPIAVLAVGGGGVLNFAGAGGEAKAAKVISKITKLEDAAQFARSIGLSEDLVSHFAPEIVKTKNVAEATDLINNIKKVQTTTKAVGEAAAGTKAVEQTPEEARRIFDQKWKESYGNRPETVEEPTALQQRKNNGTPAIDQPIAPEVPKVQASLFESQKPAEASPLFAKETKVLTPEERAARELEDIQREWSREPMDSDYGISKEGESLPSIVDNMKTPVKQKVGLLDYLRTPKYVLSKIGLSKNADELSTAYTNYLTELPKNIDRVTQWAKQISKEGNVKIFNWLNGDKSVALDKVEAKVADEIKQWLSDWADRLGMAKDERINDYITHLFPVGQGGEIDEGIAKLISNNIPGSVYDPFLLQRKGMEGYIQDTWKALDAYAKRATRKVNMDPALLSLQNASKDLELSQFNYIKHYADRINMRPTQFDTLIDNSIKQVIGYRLGARPTAAITSSARKIVSRAKLGLSFTSAFKNLTQGVNTFAELGARYTMKGYMDLFTKGPHELQENGVLLESFIQDREYGAIKKFWEMADKGVFFNFRCLCITMSAFCLKMRTQFAED